METPSIGRILISGSRCAYSQRLMKGNQWKHNQLQFYLMRINTYICVLQLQHLFAKRNKKNKHNDLSVLTICAYKFNCIPKTTTSINHEILWQQVANIFCHVLLKCNNNNNTNSSSVEATATGNAINDKQLT